MLTVSTSAEDLLAALRAGARGYLPKDMSPDRLPAALRGVLRGEAALPRTFVGRMLQELRMLPDREPAPLRVGDVELTPRESEILRLLRGGLSTLRDRRAPLALADHRAPPHLRLRHQARRRRPRRRAADDRPGRLSRPLAT